MHLLSLGLGFASGHFARAFLAAFPSARHTVVRSTPASGVMGLDDPALRDAIADATHIISAIPPAGDDGNDPVLARHRNALAASPAQWIGYLSSAGVYGDTHGAWVDESAPLQGRRSGRVAADEGWAALHPAVRVFRLPGIYGPGRSTLDRLQKAAIPRIDLPGHVFCRVHIEDITAALLASLTRGAPGIYNIADDRPAPRHLVTALCQQMLGLPVGPLESLETARVSPQGRAFYAECRRVANGKMKRELGIELRYPDYISGHIACFREMQS
ncbi:SDR family NAD(P)-dependent oxidoreductase [Polymorphobacter sp.]|uniref:SDR family NAD(P)-dependent oxidoreductase n=1 Tax=Polymorphobacter sp. TaxID=1909290 RepID=UPI003F6FEB66